MANLNGSVDRLSDALREVFREAAVEAVEPIRKEMGKGFRRIDGELSSIKSDVSKLEKNVAQVAGELAEVHTTVNNLVQNP